MRLSKFLMSSVLVAMLTTPAWAEDNTVRKMAEMGNHQAQFTLAEQYFHGRDGQPRNHQEAFSWYQKAANGGYMPAQFTMGTLYDTGEGVKRDLAQAFKWYKTVANQGEGAAAYNVAVMYESGEGVAKDPQQAYVWYSIAGIMGYKDASPFANALASTLDATQLEQADNTVISTVNSINARMRERVSNGSVAQ
ncbi:Secretory immunoglobulin A-binding protein EsiB [BD1-7 clade bacterium]|uniref:Secretory immunoglobulin A-binding protein EsiB n=1 Tax=BD1-7 clade bacterium TaxID=2029982 RepID=A0A5S9N044_9GAMM|nr:Secretory immunoglobulin A-binding protein EsiB [BD1-7 clade bacterium]CAA0081931.1 Secretory immunoglobulin A-binding protein EsiB [BD1-7 clade bacterium]CAA0082894.1 Secretory immunoglobulin A-binding protein EsiB [BD1-7 clade bacterium]